MLEEQEHSDQEAHVADAVRDEGLLARLRRPAAVLVVPEPDQQVAHRPDALPADEEQREVRAEDQDGHREDEEVQVGEVLGLPVVLGHVADRVEVDEQADTGDDQGHEARQRIEMQLERHVERAGRKPREPFVDEGAVAAGQGCEGRNRDDQRSQYREVRDRPGGLAGAPACGVEEPAGDGAEER